MGRSDKHKCKRSGSSGSTSSGNPNPAAGRIDAPLIGASTYPDPGQPTVRSSPNTNIMGASPVATPGSSSQARIVPPRIVGASGVSGDYASVQPKPFPSIKG